MPDSLHIRVSKRANDILYLLEQKNDWYSGETLAQELGISRAAISKHIMTLRTAGHAIEAITRRGYKLRVKYVPLDLVLLKKQLQTKCLGQESWHIFKTINSSNHEAVKLAMEGAAAGTIIVAEHQSQGRGTKGKYWFSSPRGLQFSIILRPNGQVFDMSALTQAAMIALVKSIKVISGLEASIKQPNDVLLDKRKIGGILVETGFRGPELDWVILGIGCNINALHDEFPLELSKHCTSLLAETGCSFALDKCMSILLNILEEVLILDYDNCDIL